MCLRAYAFLEISVSSPVIAFFIFLVDKLWADISCPPTSQMASKHRSPFVDRLPVDLLFETIGQHCFDFDKSLNERIGYADIILTGTVEKLLQKSTSSSDLVPYRPLVSGVVRVRRIFKGFLPNKHNHVIVDNFFDLNVCSNEIDMMDTRIFFLSNASRSYDDELHYKLNSSILKINLKNLDDVESGVKGRHNVERCPHEKKPCEEKLCAYGARCHANDSSGKAYCSCDFVCPIVNEPVCGTDNETYDNECFLRSNACRLQKRIRVAFRFACKQSQHDPCAFLNCKYGSDCLISKDGKSAQCLCPEKCFSYGDSRGSRPVCGEDGRDYMSLCHIRKESCRHQKHIRVKYVGLCDPCAKVSCPEGTICKLNQHREPVCRCSEQCALDYDPVCASDGNTYRNLCVMKVQACKKSLDLRAYAQGLCENIDNPCRLIKCDFGEECVIDQLNQSSCQCLNNCPAVIKEVCGKDGSTYENECQLKLQACRQKQRNAVEHHGRCGGGGICSDYECANGGICMVRNNKPFCQCQECSDDLDPVCASNGITYTNECKLRREVCRSRKPIFVKYRGFCDGCQSKICDFYSVCVSDGRGTGECLCRSEDCDKEDKPVCGTDGFSYKNECELKQASCQKRMFIMVASKTKCDSCLNVHCDWGARCQDGECVCPATCPRQLSSMEKPVCGSDGVLYKSKCFMLKAACLKGMRLTIVGNEFCPLELSPMVSTFETVSCNCNRIGSLSPACDSNGQCTCKFGVDGKQCDHCLPGFWGLQLIARGATGCTPCGCSAFGASRSDCEQMTGRCVCRAGVVGVKCDSCASRDETLTPGGCVTPDALASYYAGGCRQIRCFFGATCHESTSAITDTASCVCPHNFGNECDSVNENLFDEAVKDKEVCGSDGKTYETGCHLNKVACQSQKDLVVMNLGRCKDQRRNLHVQEDHAVPSGPKMSRSSALKYNSSVSKPRFVSSSWMLLKYVEPLFHDKLERLKIKLKIEIDSENGSILYIRGDDFSLTLTLVFRMLQLRVFQNGRKVKIRSADGIDLNKVNVVNIEIRDNYYANLSLNRGSVQSAEFRSLRKYFRRKSSSKVKGYRRPAVFLGSFKYHWERPSTDFEGIRYQKRFGFSGCIKGLQVGRKDFSFKPFPNGDIWKSFNIGECSDSSKCKDSDCNKLR